MESDQHNVWEDIMVETTARNADLAAIAALLETQQTVKHDAVVPATAIMASGGDLVIDGMGLDGPAGEPGIFAATSVMDEGIAEKLGIPVAYLRRMRTDRPDLYDANVNGWLHGYGDAAADRRRFLVRTFIGQESGVGVGRALLSDTFKLIDNLDVLVAALEGARESGGDVQVERCNLSERRMTVDLVAPQVAVNAEALLANYRNPFVEGGATRARFDSTVALQQQYPEHYGDGTPVVWGGFRIDNSETGGSRFRLTPMISIRVCKNGLVITGDAFSQVHLGGRMDEGVIQWSDETQQKSVDLVQSLTRDAVTTFLDPAYVEAKVAALTDADKPVTDAAKAVELVATRLRYTKEQTAGVLDHFIRGGQMTAFGVVNAVTSYAQCVDSPDESYDLEASAMAAFEAALSVA